MALTLLRSGCTAANTQCRGIFSHHFTISHVLEEFQLGGVSWVANPSTVKKMRKKDDTFQVQAVNQIKEYL